MHCSVSRFYTEQIFQSGHIGHCNQRNSCCVEGADLFYRSRRGIGHGRKYQAIHVFRLQGFQSIPFQGKTTGYTAFSQALIEITLIFLTDIVGIEPGTSGEDIISETIIFRTVIGNEGSTAKRFQRSVRIDALPAAGIIINFLPVEGSLHETIVIPVHKTVFGKSGGIPDKFTAVSHLIVFGNRSGSQRRGCKFHSTIHAAASCRAVLLRIDTKLRDVQLCGHNSPRCTVSMVGTRRRVILKLCKTGKHFIGKTLINGITELLDTVVRSIAGGINGKRSIISTFAVRIQRLDLLVFFTDRLHNIIVGIFIPGMAAYFQKLL